jgi:hypothetical protein
MVIGNEVKICKVYKRLSTRSGVVYRIPVLQFPLSVIISGNSFQTLKEVLQISCDDE